MSSDEIVDEIYAGACRRCYAEGVSFAEAASIEAQVRGYVGVALHATIAELIVMDDAEVYSDIYKSSYGVRPRNIREFCQLPPEVRSAMIDDAYEGVLS